MGVFGRSAAAQPTNEGPAAVAAEPEAATPAAEETAAAAPVEAGATTVATPAAEATVETQTGNPVKGTFRVFDGRANLVAQVTDEEEATKLAKEHGGTYTKIN